MIEIVTLIHNAAGSVDGENIMGQSAILMACKLPNAKIVEKLVQHGADITQCDKFGCTALHYAARSGSTTLLKYILASGVHVDAVDNSGWTALHWAATSPAGTIKSITALLDLGADHSIRDWAGRTAQDLAVQYGKLAEASVLRTKAVTRLLFTTGDEARYPSPWEGARCDACDTVSCSFSSASASAPSFQICPNLSESP